MVQSTIYRLPLESALTELIGRKSKGCCFKSRWCRCAITQEETLDTLLADIFDTCGLENDNVDIEEIAAAEIKRAQLSDVEPLQWWKQWVATYSYLSKLVTKILSVAAQLLVFPVNVSLALLAIWFLISDLAYYQQILIDYCFCTKTYHEFCKLVSEFFL